MGCGQFCVRFLCVHDTYLLHTLGTYWRSFLGQWLNFAHRWMHTDTHTPPHIQYIDGQTRCTQTWTALKPLTGLLCHTGSERNSLCKCNDAVVGGLERPLHLTDIPPSKWKIGQEVTSHILFRQRWWRLMIPIKRIWCPPSLAWHHQPAEACWEIVQCSVLPEESFFSSPFWPLAGLMEAEEVYLIRLQGTFYCRSVVSGARLNLGRLNQDP